MNYCHRCRKPTTNPKYCSRTCSAIVNNQLAPKRQPQGRCKDCSKPISTQRVYCDECTPYLVKWDETRICDIHGKAKYQVSAQIRNHARSVYRRSGRPRVCRVCGYDKHYEVCHKRAIHRFPRTTMIATVNHVDNLVALCRNHHWELDHGLLQL